MKGSKRLLALGLAAALVAQAAAAQPLPRREVPEPLKPWVDWVLRGHEDQRCPPLYGSPDRRVCEWPARLALDLGDRTGSFTQSWFLGDEALVLLPGDAKHWPQDVLVDGQPAPVVALRGQPGVRLAAGTHTLSGGFAWDALPELLQIPPQTGLVSLRIRERRVPFPNRDAQGRLWLQPRVQAEAGEESRVEVEVQRRVIDEVPLQLDTRVELRVSGRSREVVLGRALPDDFVPMSLVSPLPARLDPDGRLRVQVRPGTWQLSLAARHEGPADALVLPDPEGTWDPSEVWVFDARPNLRVVIVEDGVAVDPARTHLPAEWKRLPAYAMQPGRALRLVEKRRGDADPAPDALRLARTWWLDFDGGGYTVTDRIQGVIRRGTRLEMGPDTRLGRVSVNGEDQFITRLGGSEAVGIEVPQGEIQLSADSRLAGGARRLPAVGWDHDFRSLEGQLHLPPGWRLLHASGVDRASATWLNRWTLLDLFIVLVAAMAFLRLWGPRWGALALVALALTYMEPGAPQWAWIAVLAGEGLKRALPEGRFPRFARAVRLYCGGALAALVLIAIPFAVSQVRLGLHPALERPGLSSSARVDALLQRDKSAAAPAEMARARLESVRGPGYARDEVASQVPASKAARLAEEGRMPLAPPARLYSYAADPKARITTGPGLPTWQWERVALHWSGPVERGQQLRLVLLPPWSNRALAFGRVALLAALVLCALAVPLGGAGRWLQRSASAGALLLAALGLCAAAAPARADIPSRDMLDELRTRLLEKPECHPHCASIARLALDLSPRRLRARLEVEAVAATAIPLPGGARSWVPQTVLVNGQPARGLSQSSDGALWVVLEPGRHQLVMDGPLPDRDSVEIPLPLRPHRVEARVRGWVLHGLHEDGLAEPNLKLSRIRDAARPREAALEPGELPPFVHVERLIRLGLRWEATTRVIRVTPAVTGVVLEVPLLPGESVTAAGIRVTDGRALVSLGPGVSQAQWTSVLEQASDLTLRAPDAVPWSEIWRLDVSPIWHVDAEGIPTVHQPSPERARMREWRPWPGEEVVLRVTRPEGVEGPTTTLDGSALEVRPGRRATDVTLQAWLRSSRGGEHVVALPEGAVLESVKIGGAEQPIRQEGREVRLPLAPGTQHVELGWREPRGIGTAFRVAPVDLGVPSVNAQVRIAPGAGRWTLLAGGPRLGPAVLFWPLLAVLALLAFGLSKLPLTPLRFHHWLLLGLGLTQVPVAAAALVAGWLLALGWRRQSGTEVPGRWFDLLQVGLAMATAAALIALFLSIQQGLLGQPEMQIAGNGSTAQLLSWYQDHAGSNLPQPWLISVPLLVYRLAMLAWALWLAQALVRWLRWGWSCFSAGEIWRPLRPRVSESRL